MDIGNAVSAAECEESQAVPARRACTQNPVGGSPRKSDCCFGWSVLVFSFFSVHKRCKACHACAYHFDNCFYSVLGRAAAYVEAMLV